MYKSNNMLERLLLKISSISQFSWKLYSTKLPTFAAPPTIHLGRWCHPNFNEKCNVDIKADLANLDNGFSVEFDRYEIKRKAKN